MRLLALAVAFVLLPVAASADEIPLPGETPAWRFFTATEGLKLRPDQQAKVKELKDAWQTRHAPVREARHLLISGLQNQVRAGVVDAADLQQEIDNLATALESVRPGDAEAIAQLHTLLDPAQRQDLSGAIQDRLSPKGAGKVKIHKLAEELGLTPAQKKQLKAALEDEMVKTGAPPKEEMRAETSAVRDALVKFTTDTFAAADLPTVRKDRIEKHIARRVKLAKAFESVLTPEQRGRLAAWLGGES